MKSKLIEETSLNLSSSDFEIDDDDPFIIRSLSITILGIVIALLTILLPLIGVLLGRPESQSNEIIINHSNKKDGS